MFCSNHAKVESLYVLAEMVLKRTENINQGDLFQVPYFKYFLYTANGLWVGTEGLFGFYKLSTFCCRMTWGKRKMFKKKNQKLFFFIAEHVGVNNFGI